MQRSEIFVLPRGQFTPLANITVQGLISAAVNLILIVASLLFIITLLSGGIKFILSMGKSDKLDEAKRQILNAFIGILIVFATWGALGLLGNFFGIDFTSFEIPTP